jgi:hypothetical protein
MAQTREPRRPPTHTAPAAKQSRSHYLITGLAIAALWLLNRDKSLLYHAVQMTAVMSVLTVLQIVLRRRSGGAPAHPAPTPASSPASSAPNSCWLPRASARNGCWPP